MNYNQQFLQINVLLLQSGGAWIPTFTAVRRLNVQRSVGLPLIGHQR